MFKKSETSKGSAFRRLRLLLHKSINQYKTDSGFFLYAVLKGLYAARIGTRRTFPYIYTEKYR